MIGEPLLLILISIVLSTALALGAYGLRIATQSATQIAVLENKYENLAQQLDKIGMKLDSIYLEVRVIQVAGARQDLPKI